MDMDISVCIIARNEDNHIEECLKRLRPCKFEVIVVDTGSIDRTMELAKKYTDNIYQFTWCSDFSAARNFSIEKATNDWILIIDCDEYLENVNLLDIHRVMKDNPDKIGLIQRNNPYTIQGVKSIVSERIGRLFNRKYCHYEGSIHERVMPIDGSAPEYIEVPFTIYHEGYVTESDKRTRATRNLEMLIADLRENESDPYTYYQLGRNYVFMNDHVKAIEYYEQGLKMDCNPKDSFVASMMESYCYCLLEVDDKYCEEAVSIMDRFYDAYSFRADFLYMMGNVCMRTGDLDRAYSEFEKATGVHIFNRSGTSDFRAYYQMGTILEMKGEKDKAREMYEKSGDFAPALAKLSGMGETD
ncbi:Tetratricopeptide repeat-containing protein [Lachnospiraceae bacterium XBB2008]|nr:Tetratricopeptide repeat-containing protein [Lachnospiraceae bacterium XBB2008]